VSPKVPRNFIWSEKRKGESSLIDPASDMVTQSAAGKAGCERGGGGLDEKGFTNKWRLKKIRTYRKTSLQKVVMKNGGGRNTIEREMRISQSRGPWEEGVRPRLSHELLLEIFASTGMKTTILLVHILGLQAGIIAREGSRVKSRQEEGTALRGTYQLSSDSSGKKQRK